MSNKSWKLRNTETNEVIFCTKPRIRAGRDAAFEICCTNTVVSRNHADFLLLSDGSLHILAHQTTNGTYVNKEQIKTGVTIPLHHGDIISLGFKNCEEFRRVINPPFSIFEVLSYEKLDPNEVIELDSDEDSSDNIREIENLTAQERVNIENERNNAETGIKNDQVVLNDPEVDLENERAENKSERNNVQTGLENDQEVGLENERVENESERNNVQTDIGNDQEVGLKNEGAENESEKNNAQTSIGNDQEVDLENERVKNENERSNAQTGIENDQEVVLENETVNTNPKKLVKDSSRITDSNSKNVDGNIENQLQGTSSSIEINFRVPQTNSDLADASSSILKIKSNVKRKNVCLDKESEEKNKHLKNETLNLENAKESKLNCSTSSDDICNTQDLINILEDKQDNDPQISELEISSKKSISRADSKENIFTTITNLLETKEFCFSKSNSEIQVDSCADKNVFSDNPLGSNSTNKVLHNKNKNVPTNMKVEDCESTREIEMKEQVNSESLNRSGFTHDDYVIITDDDDDNNYDLPCSQLLQSSQIETQDQEDDRHRLSESMFYNIKMELQELDHIDVIPNPIPIDSDLDSDWMEEAETKKKTDKPSGSNIEPDAHDKFTNKDINGVDIICCETVAVPPHETSSSSENEGKLIIDENVPVNKKILKTKSEKSDSTNKPTSSHWMSKSSKGPPIIEPHIENKVRQSNKEKKETRKRKSTSSIVHIKNKVSKMEVKTPNQRIERSTTSNLREKESKRNQIREEVKEIAKKPAKEKQRTPKSVKSAVKVKVSNGRGNFLLENSSKPIKKLETTVKNSGANTTANSTASVSGHRLLRSSNLIASKSLQDSDSKKGQSSKSAQPGPSEIKSSRLTATCSNTQTISSNNLQIWDIIGKVVNWSANWLDEQKNNVDAPPVNTCEVERMRKSFNSYPEYYKVVMPLLMLELWSALFKDWISENGDQRKTPFPNRINNEQKTNDSTLITATTYIDKVRNDNGLYIKEEDLVVFEVKVRHNNQIMMVTCFAYVTSVSKKPTQKDDIIDLKLASALRLVPDFSIQFTLKTKPYSGFADKNHLMFIKIVSPMGPYLRLFKSVKYLEFSPLRQFILHPTVEDFKVPEVAHRELITNINLNPTQLKAVLEATSVCLSNKAGIYLIEGPPGTGKSTVITSIIQEILLRDQAATPCVLLVAPSNGAVDELTRRLISIRNTLDVNNRRKFRVVRVGPKKSIHPDVCQWSLTNLTNKNFLEDIPKKYPHLQKESLRKQQIIDSLEKCLQNKILSADDLKRKEKELDYAKRDLEQFHRKGLGKRYSYESEEVLRKVLSNATIICTTLSSCFSLRMETVFKHSGRITCCIVDEATQSNEQETLIPLMLGIQKLILVGDPRQLPATTLSMEAKRLDFGMSLFSRIKYHFDRKSDNPIVMLNVQYRMHPEIAMFPSETYYGGRLRTSPVCRKGKLNILKPYMVFSLPGYVPMEHYQNSNEVDFISKLVDTIFELTTDAKVLDIGIITPYNNQKDILNKTLEKKSFRKGVSFTVNTVDGFQGQEKDIIIISWVRMDGNSFISDEHRLNVALTRARSALFIVGSMFLFDTCNVLKRIRVNAQRRNLFYTINSPQSVHCYDLKQMLSKM